MELLQSQAVFPGCHRAVGALHQDGEGILCTPCFRGVQVDLAMGEQVVQETPQDHAFRARRPEAAFATEENDGVKLVPSQPQILLQRVDVERILVEGILKGMLLLSEDLRPTGIALRSKDAAAEILGFDDKDPILRDHYVIDLGGSFAVWTRQVEVVEDPVDLRIQPAQAQDNTLFTHPSLEPGMAGQLLHMAADEFAEAEAKGEGEKCSEHFDKGRGSGGAHVVERGEVIVITIIKQAPFSAWFHMQLMGWMEPGRCRSFSRGLPFAGPNQSSNLGEVFSYPQYHLPK